MKLDIVLRYTVLPGDTLSAIAAGISAQAIEAANPDIDPNALQIGSVLEIPARDSDTVALRYTVRAGDSYDGLAAALAQCPGLSYQQIADAKCGPESQCAGGRSGVGYTRHRPVHRQVARSRRRSRSRGVADRFLALDLVPKRDTAARLQYGAGVQRLGRGRNGLATKRGGVGQRA